MFNVQRLNQSTLVNKWWLALVAAGLQVQLTRDFKPAYGVDAAVVDTTVDNGTWPIYLVDSVADAPPGALAWHTVDDKGRPYGIIPVKLVIVDETFIGPTISHELLELLADPTCDRIAPAIYPIGSGKATSVAYEVADPCEDGVYEVPTPGGPVRVSDFVFPSWFENDGKGPYDFMSTLKGPLTLSPGGYMQYMRDGEWHQVQAREMQPSHNHPHTRFNRRARKLAAEKSK
jgi:hypothetical protein